MKWSIILPTYNRAWALSETVSNIQAQTLKDWELIVVDDGSTDNTRDVIHTMAQDDALIKYVYQENARQAAARNTGLLQASGEWIAYVDSDDEVYPNYLSAADSFARAHTEVWYAVCAQDRTLEKQNADHTIAARIHEEATQIPLAQVKLTDFAEWKVKPCGTGLFHKRDLNVRWDTAFRALEDLDFLLQLAQHYPGHFGYIPEKLYHQHQTFGTEGVCSNTTYGEWADYFEQLYMKHAGEWYMKNQDWYPRKVLDYREKQKAYERGEIPQPKDRYFL